MAKTYNTVPDKSAGDTFTEAMWDDSLKTNLNNLIVPACCRVYYSTTYDLAGNTDTALPFDLEDFDTDSMHDNASNNSRITFNTAGRYAVWGLVAFPASATGKRAIWVRRNGSLDDWRVQLSAPSGSLTEYLSLSYFQTFAAADYIQLMAFQNSGGPLTLPTYSRFMVQWLGKA